MLREFVLYCEQHDDRERLELALRGLLEAYPRIVDPNRSGGGILASRWYPAEMVHVLIDQMIEGRGEAELRSLAQHAANMIMRRTLSGVYRMLFSTFATPELYARHAGRLWSMHYDNGLVEVSNRTREGGHNVAHSRISRWVSHHRFVCMLNGAAARPIYELMGCKAVRYDTIACVSTGAQACEWLVHWSRGEP